MAADGASAAPAPKARPSVYGRNYSYFSHRIFVVFMPEEMHRYLDERLELVASVAGEPATDSDRLEMQLVRWVLLHRSQLNALALNRLLESWRGENDLLAIPPGLRSDPQYLMDISLQFALELELAAAQHSPMLHNRPRLLMALIDAAYYLSRQRLEIDRHADAAQAPPIDLSSTGLDGFRRYLVQRMNLEEDRRESAPVDEDAAAPMEALSTEEVQWLQGVAAGIATTLTSSSSKADFEQRWRRDVAPRWHKLGLQEPDQALFDALLIGTRAPLEEQAVDEPGRPSGARPKPQVGSLRFRWRQSAFPRPVWSDSLEKLVAGSRPALRRIRAVERRVLKAMSPSSAPVMAANDALQRPLRDLADRYRLLPTTPSWSSIEMAMDNLQRAAKGSGTIEAVYRDGQLLDEYAQMLCGRETAEVVRLALLLAAQLAGMQAAQRGWPAGPNAPPAEVDGPTAAEWEAALTALSNGLRCNEIGLPDVARRLRQCQQELAMLVPTYEPQPAAHRPNPPPDRVQAGGPSLVFWRCGSPLQEAVRGAYRHGRQVGGPWILVETVRRAWDEVARRASVLAGQTSSAPPASAYEILCQMFELGPARLLPLRLEGATFRQWTRIAAQALQDFDRGPSPEVDHVPLHLAAHALERLGIRALQRGVQQELLASWRAAAGPLREYVERERLWSGLQSSLRVAVVVGPRHDSISDAWPLPPREGLVLAATDGELRLLDRLLASGWARELPEPPLAAIEPLPPSGASQVKSWLGERFGQRYRRVWLARASQTIPEQPQLVNPKSADELWDTGDLPTTTAS